MKNAFAGQRSFLLVAALALGTFGAHAGAQSGYLTEKNSEGSSKSVVRSGTNLCWHTSAWPAGTGNPECDPAVVRQSADRSTPAEKRRTQAAAPAEKRPAQAAAPASAAAQDSGSGLAPERSVPTETAYVAPVVLEKVILSADTLFDIDKAVIKPAGKTALDKLVVKLEGNLRVVLPVGHTSSPGSDAHNMALSNRRADAVKVYLISQGIAADRIHPSGQGENNPVATNATVAGRALNRRVEIEVMGTPEDQKW